MKRVLSWLFVIALILIGERGESRTWNVEQDGSGDFVALQAAVGASASGDTILIGPGVYQELNWVDHFGNPIQVGAYWTDDKDLTFIGTSPDEVFIGPDAYVSFRDGPQGIYQEGQFRNKVKISSVTFRNLYIGAHSFGPISVDNCRFDTGRMVSLLTMVTPAW